MEVHAHTHTPRKKWTHYFWEFLMLFLAVFCGFLAENQREHMVDNKKEKEFMRSLIEDLKEDTSRINYSVRRLETDIKNADSLVMLYVQEDKDKKYERNMSLYGLRASSSVDVVFSDRTSSQLKGTGAMRLVRKKEVADSILRYWNNQIRITQIHDRFEIVRAEQRKIGNNTFNWYSLYYLLLGDARLENLSGENSMAISNKETLNEFVNTSTNLYAQAITQYLPQLKRELALATNLMSLIRNKYHIE